MEQVAPGMFSQSVTTCRDCNGTGESVPYDKRCTECNGAKVVRKPTRLNVNVEKGMRPGQTITFPGQAHEEVRSPFVHIIFRVLIT